MDPVVGGGGVSVIFIEGEPSHNTLNILQMYFPQMCKNCTKKMTLNGDTKWVC